MKTGVYVITNEVNGKRYVGQSANIDVRFSQHKSNKTHNQHLTKSMEKYGTDKFKYEILISCPEDQLNYWETYYISLFNSNNPEYGYNKTTGGKKTKFTIELIKKMIERSKKKKVINVTTNEVYTSLHEASRLTKVDRNNILKCCNNRVNTAGGYIWKYYDDVKINVSDKTEGEK